MLVGPHLLAAHRGISVIKHDRILLLLHLHLLLLLPLREVLRVVQLEVFPVFPPCWGEILWKGEGLKIYSRKTEFDLKPGLTSHVLLPPTHGVMSEVGVAVIAIEAGHWTVTANIAQTPEY
jgi:hypothetical protein